MKKVKLVKKALLPAVIAVFCSLVALTSVSYAWFQIGNKAYVEAIDVNVQAADGVRISADASSWKSILPVDDLKNKGTASVFPTTDILPMSSVGNVVDGKQEMFLGEVLTDGKLKATKDDSNYVAFDLYVDLTSDKEFYLDVESSVIGLANNDKNAEYSVRVSFIHVGTVERGEKTEQELKDGITASTIDQACDSTAIIWEPNASSHIAAVGGNAKLDYYGVKAEGASFDQTLKEKTDYLDLVKTLIIAESEQKTTEAVKLFDLKAGYSKLRVYIWLEGQDADCRTEASGCGFAVNLKFKTENPTA